MTDNRTDWNGYPNEATLDFDLWYSNHEPMYRAVNAYAADCLRRVPGMTDQTLGANVKLTVRGWITEAIRYQAPTNPGWGPTPVTDNPVALTHILRQFVDDIGLGSLHELSETDLGELVRGAVTDESQEG